MRVRQDLATSVRVFAALAVLFGGLYSLAVLGVAQALFPGSANGSLVLQGGRVVGSRLIGQGFTGPRWFDGRPSATQNDAGTRAQPYNGGASAGSNLGPTNPALLREIRANIARLDLKGVPAGRLPPDLVESSASGLDPDISPQAALIQVPRIAAARGIPAARLDALVRRSTRGRWLGMYGAPRVNVLALNLALADGLHGT